MNYSTNIYAWIFSIILVRTTHIPVNRLTLVFYSRHHFLVLYNSRFHSLVHHHNHHHRLPLRHQLGDMTHCQTRPQKMWSHARSWTPYIFGRDFRRYSRNLFKSKEVCSLLQLAKQIKLAPPLASPASRHLMKV